MFLNSKSRHAYHRASTVSVYFPLITNRHRRLFSLSHVGGIAGGMMGICHSKSNCKKIYLIWFTIIGYIIGAYLAYNIYFDTKTGVERKRDEQHRISNNGEKAKEGMSTFSMMDEKKNDNLLFKGNTKLKRILFWTEFYKESSLDSLCIRPDTLATCPFQKCEFTLDKQLLTSSDAIIFHGRDLWGSKKLDGYTDTYIDMPKFRSENQLWIFLMLEAPVHTWINLEPFDNLFNMTMTYRPDSDIYSPYGKISPIDKKTIDDQLQVNQFQTWAATGNIEAAARIRNYSTKNLMSKRLVAWSVSNCYKTPSRRNEVVHELHKYIPIDIYGDCGSLNCTPKRDLCDSGLECHRYLANKYKFYLAFENSLCEDYITEKFYDSLYVGMVPVVYGYGDYTRVAPKGSYIDASVFPTMKSLANYLLYLDKHPLEYLKYFEWKKTHTITVSYFKEAWCSLCTKLWTSAIGSMSVSEADLQDRSRTTFEAAFGSRINLNSQNGNRNGGDGSERYMVKNLSDWWFHKSSPGTGPSAGASASGGSEKTWTLGNNNFKSKSKFKSSNNVQLKENACMNPTQLKWDPNIFSFYGFIYYPNYSVKMGFLYAVLIFGFLFVIYLVRFSNVSKRMSKMY